MERLAMETANITNKNIDKILELFPNVATEGVNDKGEIIRAIDFEKLKQELSEVVVDGEESYDFTWVGKKEAMIEANRPIRKTLRPQKDKSLNWDTTENIYIEGDNLEALKLLQESYLGKIKMIYIDPPYNTGNDSFIYPDNYSEDKNSYDEEIGAIDDNGFRIFKNVESNGRFHSSWCSMIYSRLKLARNLLSDDGVIFISIDDNEIDNLRKICDEIWGEPNYIGMYIKQSKVGGGSDTKFIVKEHEYCLVYAKNILSTSEMYIEHDAEYLKRYKEADKKGRFFWDTFARPGLKNPIIYEIIAPDKTILKNGWIRSKERFLEEYANGDIRIIKKDDGNWSVQFKQYLNENGKKPRSMTMDFGGSIDGKKDFFDLFSNDKIFSYPKSNKFIMTLQKTILNEQKNAIILDFFSGSATTAHACMQLNAEDGGNRKFIMVQLPEVCDESSEAYKAGYKNICEIGEERIRRAGKKIQEENPDKKIDVGFRVFKVDDTNMKDIFYSPAETDQQKLGLLESNIKEDRTDEDLLYSCLLEWGIELSLPHTIEEIEGKRVHIINAQDDFAPDLVACFEEDIPESVIRKIAQMKPTKVVFRDNSFIHDDNKINVEEIFKLITPDTRVKVL